MNGEIAGKVARELEEEEEIGEDSREKNGRERRRSVGTRHKTKSETIEEDTWEALGFTPGWLLWLRYSTFIILYPTGITSEVGLIYNALPYMREYGKYRIRMPNKLNFGFDYYYNALLTLGVYVPGIPDLYGYMLGQRKKALSKPKTA
ncbi:hypothetical protein ACS0TY_013582 [Phlomoides rotata]